MQLSTIISQLRLVAILEGISYISFGLTMPLKYMLEIKEPNYVVGMAHGILFVIYCIWVLLAYFGKKINPKVTLILLVASLIPFMTFWAEKKYLRNV
jgi:integral membrane protein